MNRLTKVEVNLNIKRMLTKSDKKFIEESIEKALMKNNDSLLKGILELFNVTNERIDSVEGKLTKRIDSVEEKLGEKIDKVLNRLENHEDRIEKLEDKI